ncbi:MAG: hypothetical protein AAFY32_03635, partial [Pseudomonadota bacterium]
MTQALVPTLEDEHVLKALIDHAGRQTEGDWRDGDHTDPAFESLLEQFARFATGDDYLWAHPDLLFERAARVWAAGQTRTANTSIIDLSIAAEDRANAGGANANGDAARQSRRTVLKLITEDKPFVVDSITAAITEAGK